MEKNLLNLDDKLLRIFERGAIAPVNLQPLSYEDAQSLRMRLYRTKQKLLKSDHPVSHKAKLTMIRLIPLASGSFCLTVCPREAGLEEAFINAGITDPSDEPPSLD